jgi:3-dehydroquinate dehydratase II
MLGLREPSVYGSFTLADIDESLRNLAEELDVQIEIVQSNMEGALVLAVQEAANARFDGVLVNPAAYGHTSVALRDAMLAVNLPFVEVHISNIYAREEFRHKSYLTDIASGVIVGFGPMGYLLGLRGLAQMLGMRHVARESENLDTSAN